MVGEGSSDDSRGLHNVIMDGEPPRRLALPDRRVRHGVGGTHERYRNAANEGRVGRFIKTGA